MRTPVTHGRLVAVATLLVAAIALTGQVAPAITGVNATPVVAATTQDQGMDQAADLRVHLDHLLSEHTVLAGITTQKAAINAPDFQAAFNHLDQNSTLLSEFMGSLYGPDAAAQF